MGLEQTNYAKINFVTLYQEQKEMSTFKPKEVEQLETYYEEVYRFKQNDESFVKWALLSWEPPKKV